jgi:UrcA family protein
MSTSTFTRITQAALVITALASPLCTNAAAAGAPPASAIVQYRDLDLSTGTGLQALYERIKTAAQRVCLRETSAHPGIDQRARYFACCEDAIANSIKQLDPARLAALHREQLRLTAN